MDNGSRQAYFRTTTTLVITELPVGTVLALQYKACLVVKPSQTPTKDNPLHHNISRSQYLECQIIRPFFRLEEKA
jgi:hypothetical protein